MSLAECGILAVLECFDTARNTGNHYCAFTIIKQMIGEDLLLVACLIRSMTIGQRRLLAGHLGTGRLGPATSRSLNWRLINNEFYHQSSLHLSNGICILLASF